MKSDESLRRELQAELAWDPSCGAAEVAVDVADGVVTLSGHVASLAERHALRQAVQRVDGVRALALEVDVRLPEAMRRSDVELAAMVEQVLRWNVQVPAAAVQVSVDRGQVTLRGELEADFQRRSMLRALRPLRGVVALVDLTRLVPPAGRGDTLALIRAALARQPHADDAAIEVSLQGVAVLLQGRVRTWSEREAAQRAAASAPGVSLVMNYLTVGR